VAWGYRPRAELVEAGPHLLVDAPSELAALAP
jgi:phosphoglycolate phosphatase-like HAD superfamily hydrolase